MSVFNTVLSAIQRHRVYRGIDEETGTGEYRCTGCNWTDTRAGTDDEHLAEMIDKAID